MASVTVCGIAHRSVTPDRAQLDLALTHVAPTAAVAMDTIATRSRQLDQILTGLGFVPNDWSTERVSVAEAWEWKKDTNVKVGYRATSGTCVRIGGGQLDRIADLIQAAIDDADAQIRNLSWSVSPDHSARHDLLGEAVGDAVRRARAYVDALDLELGAVEEVSDLAPITPAPTVQPQVAAMRVAKMADGAEPMSVSAGEIELSATVYVRYATLTKH